MKKYIITLLIGTLFFQTSCLKEDDGSVVIPPIQGATLQPEVGGGTEPNQVWVDLSTGEMTSNPRPAWDLGFYSGNEFRVILNNSILMAAGSIESNNIDAVSESDFEDLIDILTPAAGFPEDYIDDETGNYLNDGTAISGISENDAENKVYLLKLGYELYPNENDVPENSVYTIGNPRGFKKIRILRNDGNSYKIQFADLNDTEHSEFIVEKDADYHFTFYSFDTNSTVQIQPEKNDWDLCFTVWNNVIEGFGTYTYADFIINNTMSGTGVYQITTDPAALEEDYNNFSAADVDESLFNYDDQRAIGSNWRSTVSGTSSDPVVYSDRFFVLKDADGILFKIRFISMLGENNERGFPQFEYEPL
jgi:hypothetical protein